MLRPKKTFLEALKKQGEAWREWQGKFKTESNTKRRLAFGETELLCLKKRLEDHLVRVKNQEAVDKYIEINKVTSLYSGLSFALNIYLENLHAYIFGFKLILPHVGSKVCGLCCDLKI